MKIDLLLPRSDFATAAQRIIQAENWGFDGVWSAEWQRNAFFPLTLAANNTRSPFTLGALAAAASARSPMISAQIAWDLASQSDGRFMLGLDAEAPSFLPADEDDRPFECAAKLREYIESLRAIWRTFQDDARLRFRGRHYRFRLMTPFFNPGPIAKPDIPIFLSGDDSAVWTLAGELCQGWQASALHSASFLREQILPALKLGLASAGRSRDSFELVAPVPLISPRLLAHLENTEKTEKTEKITSAKPARNEAARINNDFASYAFSRNYEAFAAYHGWQAPLDSLRARARAGAGGAIWQSMPEDMLREIAIVAQPEHAPAAIAQRYSGLADRVCIIFADWHAEEIAGLAAGLREQPRDQRS